jgi:DNA-binding transcriptional ArsR family regulator
VKDGPNIARVAGLIGDPARAEILTALLAGRALTATELAAVAGVTKQTVSAHLAKLVDARLLAVEAQGRHRYFRLADADVAHALETLSFVAERSAAFAKWEQGAYRPLKAARTCYNHLAGELGVALFEGLLARGTLASADGSFELTESGRYHLHAIGLAAPADKAARRYAYPCLDWSERRDHLAGSLAAALLDHCLERRWLRRTPGSRAVALTPAGTKSLAPWLDLAQRPAAPAQLTSQLS